MQRLLALALAGFLALPLNASAGIQNWSTAASIFDAKSIAGVICSGISPSVNGLPITPDIWGPGGVPKPESHDLPSGIGPANEERKPGYFGGLFGGLFGLLLAPVAFALEMIQAAALTPARMLRGMADGDWLSLLEPLRTAKNIFQDCVLFSVGMLNLASAPVWNAFRPDQAADFIYANNRLVFAGGPVAGMMNSEDAWNAVSMTPSWHTNFVARQYLAQPFKETLGANEFSHEFVHNAQWKESFLWENIGESYRGYKGWRNEDAQEYLNW